MIFHSEVYYDIINIFGLFHKILLSLQKIK